MNDYSQNLKRTINKIRLKFYLLKFYFLFIKHIQIIATIRNAKLWRCFRVIKGLMDTIFYTKSNAANT